MLGDNYGTQSGSGSINVGVGDFRGANVHVGDEKPTFSTEQMKIMRHFVLGGFSVERQKLSIFGLITGIAGLCITLFPQFAQLKPSLWLMLFLFLFIAMFGLGMLLFFLSLTIKKRKFMAFSLGKFYLELGADDKVYISYFTATCPWPWCREKMNLRSVGPENGPRDDIFFCDRNPKQHTILLDPTILPTIAEH